MTSGAATESMPVVITIAGSDSGGGAGIQADLKTFEAHGVFGTTAITSITAQNTVGVRAVHDLPLDVIAAQLAAVFDDFDVRAVKIGMLSSRAIIALVAEILEERAAAAPVVLDPVMVATSGDRLIAHDAVDAILDRLLPLATVVTPNSDEAAILAGFPVGDHAAMRRAGERIVARGARSALVKGGHIPPSAEGGIPMLCDLLVTADATVELPTPFIPTTSTHGTGCTLSSAIAALLAHGHPLVHAVREAQSYVHGAIASAPGLGAGHGPLRHAWRAS